jgi:peptidoglycan/LPS O-acetylase OafA/YrhL
MNTNDTVYRLHYLDWLRVIAALMVFCFHAAMIFVSWDWHIKDSQTSFIMDTFVRFIHLWIMPLFFLLAGASAWCSLRHRTGCSYLGERFRRLIIPLLFGTLFVIPPQVYMERLSYSEFNGSFLQFYSHFFDGVYPAGNFTWNHLWFLLYLFVISMIALPILQKARADISLRLESIIVKPWIIFLPIIPIIFIEAAFRYTWPSYLYPTDMLLFLLFFIYGYLIVSENKIRQAIVHYAKASLLLGLISFGTIVVMYLTNNIPAPGSTWGYVIFKVCWSSTAWLWIVSIVGLGIKHLNYNNRFLSHANEAVLPFYILHHTAILIVGYYAVHWNINLFIKYIFIVTISFIATTIVL